MDKEVVDLWDYMLDNGIVSQETLEIVTSINGYSKGTLEDVLFAATGYRSLAQIEESEEE